MISLTAANGSVIKYGPTESASQYWDWCTNRINAVEGATQLTVDCVQMGNYPHRDLLRSDTGCCLQDPRLKVVFDNVVDLEKILDTPGDRFLNTQSLHVKFGLLMGSYQRKVCGWKLRASFPDLKSLIVTLQPGNAVCITNLYYWEQPPSCVINSELQQAELGHLNFDLDADNYHAHQPRNVSSV